MWYSGATVKTEETHDGACIIVVKSGLRNTSRLEQVLADGGYQAVLYSIHDTMFRLVRDEPPALVMLNVASALDVDALRLLKLLRLNQRTRRVPTIVRTAEPEQLRGRVERLGLRWCWLLRQTCTEDKLLAMIREAIDAGAGNEGS